MSWEAHCRTTCHKLHTPPCEPEQARYLLGRLDSHPPSRLNQHCSTEENRKCNPIKHWLPSPGPYPSLPISAVFLHTFGHCNSVCNTPWITLSCQRKNITDRSKGRKRFVNGGYSFELCLIFHVMSKKQISDQGSTKHAHTGRSLSVANWARALHVKLNQEAGAASTQVSSRDV